MKNITKNKIIFTLLLCLTGLHMLPLSAVKEKRKAPQQSTEKSQPQAKRQNTCQKPNENYDHALEKVSVENNDVVKTCQWDDCNQTFLNNNQAFFSHVNEQHMANIKKNIDEKYYYCQWNECAYGNAYLNKIKKHIRKHTGEKPFKCLQSGCRYTSNWANTFYKHMCNKHLYCSQCEEQLSSKSEMTEHIYKNHSRKNTTKITQQKRHKTGQTPNENDVLKHEGSPHSIIIPTFKKSTGVKTCQWDGCNEMFLNNEAFYSHVKDHATHSARDENKRFPCKWKECFQYSTWKHFLVKHMQRHTDRRSLKCCWPGCGYATYSQSSLSQHKWTCRFFLRQ